jgi:hypothetical protein
MAMPNHTDRIPEMRIKHLELIQSALSRMSDNSARLKGHCLSLVSAIVGLAAALTKDQIVIYTFPILAGFAILDAYYLALERGFRMQYENVRKRKLEEVPDFAIVPQEREPWLKAFFSLSVIGFYGAVAAVMILIYIFMPDKTIIAPVTGAQPQTQQR